MFNHELSSLKDKSLLRLLREVDTTDGVSATIDGKKYTLFCSNDYLGLSRHQALKAAATKAIADAGTGAGSASLISGYTGYHKALEIELARFKGSDAALLFGSGYLANVGAIPALADAGDAIISDSLNHASIIDGCRLSRADRFVYEHADMASLEAALKASCNARRRLIITEGVFSMDGDIAPLPSILELAERYDAVVYLDEAHATGVIGPTGRGTIEYFCLNRSDRLIQMGTSGKALGSYGAFIAGPDDYVQWLINSARSFIFATALPPAVCAAASAALGVITDEPWRLARLKDNSYRLRAALIGMGLDVIGDETPIIPVVAGPADKTVTLFNSLMDAGFYAPAIRPPTVADGQCRIRFTVSAEHSDDDIERLIETMRVFRLSVR